MIIMENLIPKVANNEAVTTILPDDIVGFCVHRARLGRRGRGAAGGPRQPYGGHNCHRCHLAINAIVAIVAINAMLAILLWWTFSLWPASCMHALLNFFLNLTLIDDR